MKKVFQMGVVTILLAMMIGCASTKQFVPLPNQSQRLDNPQKARIYVYRPKLSAYAIEMTVKDNGQVIGSTGAFGYLCWERESGKMLLESKAENVAKLELDIEDGMVYYVQQLVRPGVFFARNKLKLQDEEKAQKKLKKCKKPSVFLN